MYQPNFICREVLCHKYQQDQLVDLYHMMKIMMIISDLFLDINMWRWKFVYLSNIMKEMSSLIAIEISQY